MASYFEAMSERVRESKWAIVPVWLAVGMLIGAVPSYFMPGSFFTEAQWQVSAGLYGAILTVNGLILAISWNAFSRIHDSIISSSGFSSWLRKEKLLNTYLFYIDYVQVTQLIALFASAAALFSILIDLPSELWDRAILAVSLGLSIYAVKYAVNAVTVMHDLVWQKSIFEEQEEAAKSNKLVRLGADGGQNAR